MRMKARTLFLKQVKPVGKYHFKKAKTIQSNSKFRYNYKLKGVLTVGESFKIVWYFFHSCKAYYWKGDTLHGAKHLVISLNKLF